MKKLNIGNTDENADWIKHLPGHANEVELHDQIAMGIRAPETQPLGQQIINGVLDGLKSLRLAVKQTAGAQRYRSDLRGAAWSLWDGTISGPEFLRVVKYQIVPLGLTQAWLDGAAAEGVTGEGDLNPEEKTRLKERITQEKTYVRGFRDYIKDHDKASGSKRSSLDYRLDLWVNRYMDVVNEARVMAGGDKKYKWVWYPDAEHCRSCRKLHGQVRRASFWKDHDCRPQHPSLECMTSAGGPTVCKCEFEETDEPLSRGPLPGWRA